MTNLKKIQYTPTITIKKSNSDREVKVLVRRIGISIFKAQRVIDQIRGRSYEETLMILELMPYRAAYPILKLIYSAAANANHNMGLNEADLFISKAEANRSIIRKKLRPRARGRSYVIKKSMCHITIVLKEKSKSFVDQSTI
uniref:ribosomal protein L22 n=1 Tax=Dapsilanthus disjunctus TaxID=2919630 RepID=UPI001F13E83A|nr:ribosomal protein L22 [Dapsilanthus disjunctus]ULQ65114.1 ribosomal protein L22 [Dapsilanthus disjunctus]ULQ65202.1 ribosomal protein L22 [Dapsilanthus disjunctus]